MTVRTRPLRIRTLPPVRKEGARWASYSVGIADRGSWIAEGRASAAIRDPRPAMTSEAIYAPASCDAQQNLTLDFSRRARGVAIWAALRSLGRDGLRREYGPLIRDSLTEVGRRRLSFEEARDIAERILVLYREGGFDTCSVIYNRFRSAMTQIVTVQQLIPFAPAGRIEPLLSRSWGCVPVQFMSSSHRRKRSLPICFSLGETPFFRSA